MPALLLPAAAPAALRRAALGDRLRRAAQRAASNPWASPPLRAAAPWTAGQTVRSGAVRAHAGNLYVSMSDATCGTIAPVHMSDAVAYARDSADLSGVLWSYLGPVETAADMADAPVVSGPAAAEPTNGYENRFGNQPSGAGASHIPGAFTLRGGFRDPASPSRARTYTDRGGAAATFSRVCWEFDTDAPTLALVMAGINGRFVQVTIDGRRVSNEGLLVNSTPESTTLTFAGGVRTRRIRIAAAGQLQLQAVRVPSSYQIWPAGDADTVRAYCIADSIWQGSAMGPFLVGGWVAQRIGDLLGWADMWDASIGGTGYTPRYDGNGQIVANQAYTYGERVAEGLTRNPDIWVLMGSTNDGGRPAAEITAAALAAYRAIRAGSAAPIVVLGVWPMNNSTPAIEAAVKAAVDQFADPLTFFVPVTADADTGLAWALGPHNRTMMPGATQGVAAFADGTHGTDFAEANLARRIDGAIRRKVLPLL